jgi:hypothetical protein
MMEKSQEGYYLPPSEQRYCDAKPDAFFFSCDPSFKLQVSEDQVTNDGAPLYAPDLSKTSADLRMVITKDASLLLFIAT